MKVFRIFLMRFLPLALIILAVSIWVIEMQRVQFLEMVQVKERKGIETDISVLNTWVDTRINDIAFLRDMVSLSYDESEELGEYFWRVSSLFLSFASAKSDYSQIRLLSPEGMELVRVNSNESGVRLVPEDELQDKSGRYYFKRAIDCGGNINISKFDLNIENGKIVEPYEPVLRASTCIYGSDGRLLGVIVSNFSGERLLGIFNAKRRDSFGDIWLVNQEGGWLIGPDPDNDWIFMTGDEKGLFQNMYPEEWEIISEDQKGRFSSSAGGLFFYERYSISSEKGVYAPDTVVESDEDWVVVSHVPSSRLAFYWWYVFGGVIFGVVLWTGIIIWKRAVTSVRQQEMAEALMESEQRFLDVSNAAGEFIWETGPEGTFTFVTGRSNDVLGLSPEELIGKSPFDFAIEEDSWNIRKDFLDAAQTGQSFNGLEYRCVSGSGEVLWINFNGVPILDSEETVIGFRGAAFDITDRKKSEQELRESEELLSSVSNSVQDGLVLMDEDGVVQHYNPAALRLFKFSSDIFEGMNLRDYVRLDDGGGGQGELFSGRCIEGSGAGSCPTGKLEVICTRSDGSEFPAEVAVSPLRRSGSWWVVWSIRDITERKESEEKLLTLATTDSLTGLINRRRFMEKAEAELDRARRYGRPLSMMMLDIDHFKRVNDTYGHDAGDDVLKTLSRLGLEVLRKVDFFGRIGGEEFSVLLPDTSLEGAVQVAERLREEVENAVMETRSGDLSITISIGVSTLNEEINNLETMLKAADVALYAAKRGGRNRVSVQESAKGTVE